MLPAAQPATQTVTLVHTTRNMPAMVMGILSIWLGVTALLVCWIPFLGMISIPFACVGGLLALIGFVVAACKEFNGWILPAIGAGLCLLGLIVCMFITTVFGNAVSEGIKQQEARQKAQSDKLEKQLNQAMPQFPTLPPPPEVPRSRAVPNRTGGMKF